MAKNIIIGVGNLLFCDDGVGVIATHYLKQNYKFEPNVEILDGGTLGFNLAEYFLEYENVFIIDTVSVDDKVGAIYKIPSQELLGHGSYKNTAHEVEVLQMLEICQLYDKMATVTIFGIVAEDISSVKIGLSENLIKEFDNLIKSVLDELKELNIKVTKCGDSSLQSVVKSINLH